MQEPGKRISSVAGAQTALDEEDRRPSATASLGKRKGSYTPSFTSIQSKLGLLRLGKYRKASKVSQTSQENDICFFSLPLELQQQVIEQLPLADLFTCRLVSRSFNEAVCDSARRIKTQDKLKGLPGGYLRPRKIESRPLQDLYHEYRRRSVCRSLAGILFDYIAEELMRLNRRQRKILASTRTDLIATLAKLLLPLYDFLALFRLSILREKGGLVVEPGTATSAVDGKTATRNSEEQALSSTLCEHYGVRDINAANSMHSLLIHVFRRWMRSPTYMTAMESSLRGFHAKKPSEESLFIALYMGGLESIDKILGAGSYNAKVKALRSSLERLTVGKPAEWKRAWGLTLDGPFYDSWEEEWKERFKIPDEGPYFTERPDLDWPSKANTLLKQMAKRDGDWNVRDFVSGLLGYDMLLGISILRGVSPDDNNEEESSSESNSDDENGDTQDNEAGENDNGEGSSTQ